MSEFVPGAIRQQSPAARRLEGRFCQFWNGHRRAAARNAVFLRRTGKVSRNTLAGRSRVHSLREYLPWRRLASFGLVHLLC